MAFDAYMVSIELAKALRQPIERLRRRDRSLADQLQRAVQSVVLNVAEGARRNGRDRQHLFAIASGSAAEVRAALDLAEAFGHVDATPTARLLLDREMAMLWRLSRRRVSASAR